LMAHPWRYKLSNRVNRRGIERCNGRLDTETGGLRFSENLMTASLDSEVRQSMRHEIDTYDGAIMTAQSRMDLLSRVAFKLETQATNLLFTTIIAS
jgi:hypothetical protein